MNIVVPYTRVHPDTWAALWDLNPRYVDTSGDVEAYWRLLCELWEARQAFLIVEHDNVPKPGALEAMWQCKEPWCAYPYPVGTPWDTPCLGCSRFRPEIMAAFPDLMEKVGATFMGLYEGERITGKHWNRMDMTISLWLIRRGHKMHKHPEGMVEHRHVYACT